MCQKWALESSWHCPFNPRSTRRNASMGRRNAPTQSSAASNSYSGICQYLLYVQDSSLLMIYFFSFFRRNVIYWHFYLSPRPKKSRCGYSGIWYFGLCIFLDCDVAIWSRHQSSDFLYSVSPWSSFEQIYVIIHRKIRYDPKIFFKVLFTLCSS
jgi:hypothetical protein